MTPAWLASCQFSKPKGKRRFSPHVPYAKIPGKDSDWPGLGSHANPCANHHGPEKGHYVRRGLRVSSRGVEEGWLPREKGVLSSEEGAEKMPGRQTPQMSSPRSRTARGIGAQEVDTAVRLFGRQGPNSVGRRRGRSGDLESGSQTQETV